MKVELINAFREPVRNAVATAKSCYSKEIVTEEKVTGDYPEFAKGLLDSGHTTVHQHAYFQFAISDISRHLVWDFLHAHPYYNSEQVSQRFVSMDGASYHMPDGTDTFKETYRNLMQLQYGAYERLIPILEPVAMENYLSVFKHAKKDDKAVQSKVRKLAMEAARYVLPLSCHTHLYHTVSALTLLRYAEAWKYSQNQQEAIVLVDKMIQAVCEYDPSYKTLFADFLTCEGFHVYEGIFEDIDVGKVVASNNYFDASFFGEYKKSVLVSPASIRHLTESVREATLNPDLSKEDAIALLMDSRLNESLLTGLNSSIHSRLGECLNHMHFTFRTRISHCADSQAQRHRSVSASRPYVLPRPDGSFSFETPSLIQQSEEALELYGQIMGLTRLGIKAMTQHECGYLTAAYALPNAVTVRYTETASLAALQHKSRMRLCYLAQEEIWQSCVEQVKQITEAHPLIGKYLLPPCTHRYNAGEGPYCPEGKRFCGVQVWKKSVSEYERLI